MLRGAWSSDAPPTHRPPWVAAGHGALAVLWVKQLLRPAGEHGEVLAGLVSMRSRGQLSASEYQRK
jgi:hypothetical protein